MQSSSPRTLGLALGLMALVLAYAPASQAGENIVDLQVSLRLGPLLEPAYTSGLVYMTVTNSGPDPAVDTAVAIQMPEPFMGGPFREEPSCQASKNLIQCTLPRIEAGDHAVIEVEWSPPPESFGPFELSATATGGGADRDLANNEATLLTEGYGRVRLTGAGCSSTGEASDALSALGALLLLVWLRMRRPSPPGREHHHS